MNVPLPAQPLPAHNPPHDVGAERGWEEDARKEPRGGGPEALLAASSSASDRASLQTGEVAARSQPAPSAPGPRATSRNTATFPSLPACPPGSPAVDPNSGGGEEGVAHPSTPTTAFRGGLSLSRGTQTIQHVGSADRSPGGHG